MTQSAGCMHLSVGAGLLANAVVLLWGWRLDVDRSHAPRGNAVLDAPRHLDAADLGLGEMTRSAGCMQPVGAGLLANAVVLLWDGGWMSIVHTLRVVTPRWTLRVPRTRRIYTEGNDAERRGMHAHAERGNDQHRADAGQGAGLLANACIHRHLHSRTIAFASKPAPTGIAVIRDNRCRRRRRCRCRCRCR